MSDSPLADALGITLAEDQAKEAAALKAEADAQALIAYNALSDEEKRVRKLEEDAELARQTIIQSINQNNKAIDNLMNVALETQSGRIYEVLAGMIRHNADIAEKVLKIHADKQKVQNNHIALLRNEAELANGVVIPTSSSTVIHANNIAFVGSTTELLRMIKAEQQNVIDAESQEIDS